MAPDKIYLPEEPCVFFQAEYDEDLYPIEYIRKDALLELLKECKENPVITDLQKGNIQEIIEKIESL